MKTKRQMAGELVGEFGKYMPDAPTTPYFIRLNGKFMCSADTAELAEQVEAYFSKRDLVGLMDTIPREDDTEILE